MSIDLEAQLPVIGPLAIQWALSTVVASEPRAMALIPPHLEIAKRVGVRHPEEVRICVVDRVPMPADPALSQAAAQVGLTGEGLDGLTLGYVVFVRRGHEMNLRLLSHEFRHVAQYESCGGIPNFLSAHLRHLVSFGYEDSPFEVDARAHEIHAV
jgi:hypothetical protein